MAGFTARRGTDIDDQMIRTGDGCSNMGDQHRRFILNGEKTVLPGTQAADRLALQVKMDRFRAILTRIAGNALLIKHGSDFVDSRPQSVDPRGDTAHIIKKRLCQTERFCLAKPFAQIAKKSWRQTCQDRQVFLRQLDRTGSQSAQNRIDESGVAFSTRRISCLRIFVGQPDAFIHSCHRRNAARPIKLPDTHAQNGADPRVDLADRPGADLGENPVDRHQAADGSINQRRRKAPVQRAQIRLFKQLDRAEIGIGALLKNLKQDACGSLAGGVRLSLRLLFADRISAVGHCCLATGGSAWPDWQRPSTSMRYRSWRQRAEPCVRRPVRHR